ncbi:MAG: glycosyltransferase [Myxococcota bacterium]
MKFTILAPGSRGDVQPYVALGVGLSRAGHAVRVVTTRDHHALVEAHALELAAVPFDVQAALSAPPVARALERSSLLALRSFREIALKAARLTAEVGLEAGRGADVLVAGFSGAFLAEGIARRLDLPLVQAYNVPLTPTAAFPGALTPWLDFGPRSRRLGHVLSRQAVWMTARMSSDDTRRKLLGMPSAPRFAPSRFAGLVEGPVLYGYSTSVLPRGPEWGEDVEVTGFWFLDEPAGFAPPAALADFLAEGSPPVCIGFGSMSQRDPRRVTALVLEAINRAGVRAILLSGWGQLTAQRLPPGVFALESAPHSWLFPRCAGVVHHGGAGTTAAALRAGVPSLVVAFHGDQPFWGQLVHRAGAGPRPLLHRKLTVDELARGLSVLTHDAAVRKRAQALGAVIRAEDGVRDAVKALARLATR